MIKHANFQLYRAHPDGVISKKLTIGDKYINKTSSLLQYTYCPISHEVKATRQLTGITRGILFFKNHAENEARRLVSDLFLFLKKSL